MSCGEVGLAAFALFVLAAGFEQWMHHRERMAEIRGRTKPKPKPNGRGNGHDQHSG